MRLKRLIPAQPEFQSSYLFVDFGEFFEGLDFLSIGFQLLVQLCTLFLEELDPIPQELLPAVFKLGLLLGFETVILQLLCNSSSDLFNAEADLPLVVHELLLL